MELRIRGDLEKIRKLIPIIDEMAGKEFISEYPFIAPFQYDPDNKQAVAIIKATKGNNLIIEGFK